VRIGRSVVKQKNIAIKLDVNADAKRHALADIVSTKAAATHPALRADVRKTVLVGRVTRAAMQHMEAQQQDQQNVRAGVIRYR